MAMILPLLIALVVVYLIRQPRRAPSMQGRLVARSPELHTEIVRAAAEAHATFAARHTVNFNPPRPDPLPKYDMLAAYWPKDVPRE